MRLVEQIGEFMHFGQVANFKTNSKLPIEKFPIALNSNLKSSIKIQKAEEVDERFHSRLNCKKKTYRYIINNSKNGTAIYRNLETHIPQKLDVEKMQQAVKYFEGEHDFKAFKSSGTSGKNSVRTIYKAEVRKEGEDTSSYEISGIVIAILKRDGFSDIIEKYVGYEKE